MHSLKKKPYGTDILLLLLYAPGKSGIVNEPIKGVTRLQKELFLAQKMLKDENIKYKYPFRPYRLGPFTKDLYRDIEWLQNEGIVEVKRIFSEFAGIYRVFKLTEKGCKEVANLLKDPNFERIFRVVTEVKREFNHMNPLELVEYTHRIFPEYVRSKNNRS